MNDRDFGFLGVTRYNLGTEDATSAGNDAIHSGAAAMGAKRGG
jgi:hypothetical protein